MASNWSFYEKNIKFRQKKFPNKFCIELRVYKTSKQLARALFLQRFETFHLFRTTVHGEKRGIF